MFVQVSKSAKDAHLCLTPTRSTSEKEVSLEVHVSLFGGLSKCDIFLLLSLQSFFTCIFQGELPPNIFGSEECSPGF